jgi:phage terminase small subunit
MPTPKPNLTIKQEKFCLAYIETGNASEAYRRAYDCKKMSANAIAVNASRLMDNTKVALRVAELQANLQKRHEVTVDRIISELALLGFSNMLDYMQPQDDGTAYVDLSKLTREQAAAISEVTVESYMEGHGEDARPVKKVKFKLTDKRSALVDLGKHFGMFKDIHEVSGKNGGPIEIAEMSEKERARRIAMILSKATRPNGHANGHADPA